ncbi:MAG: 2-hydroxyacid dehydrogenase [Bacillota bacterium]
MKIRCIGDVMIPDDKFIREAKKLAVGEKEITSGNWEMDWDDLQDRRLVIEKNGPGAEEVVPEIKNADEETEILLVLYCPVSEEAIKSLPNLKLVGAARAGMENIDVEAATENGVIVEHVMGRNAQAVSDFSIGLMLSESRNIAKSHKAVKNNWWRKEFPNSDFIPEMEGKKIGLVGFGYIGQLVAKKLGGFDVEILAYDPYKTEEEIAELGATKVEKEELFKNADFVSVHARLGEDNKGMIGKKELNLMKETSYFINTARAGLIDEDALYNVLKEGKIAGAGLDVFWNEPLEEGSRWLELDNVTITSHIAGTTTEALNKSPRLLVEDINRLIKGEEPKFLVNPEVLDKKEVKEWLESLR